METANALDSLNINDNYGDLSDDYDFVEDVERRPSRTPRTKYMQLLQNVADRQVSQVLIDLDDLKSVRDPHSL